MANPAPEDIYQSCRVGGNFSYLLSGLTPGAGYTVQLDFATNLSLNNNWLQTFNVSINGAQVLTNYDLYATLGVQDKATSQQFQATADSNGQISLNFAGNNGNAQINGIEVLTGTTRVLAIDAGTVAGGITINSATNAYVGPLTFVNEGIIQGSNGETLTIDGPWTNASGATITASGATLDLGDQNATSTNAWSNAGTINVTNSTLNLGGLFTLPGMGAFNQTANTVSLVGTLDNTGTTLALSPATGSWTLAGGTLKNGTLAETGGAELVFTTSGTLDGVTVDGNLDLTAGSGNYASANVLDGLVLNGTAYLGNVPGTTYGALDFNDTETLSGTGTVVFGSNYNNALSPNTSSSPTTLTIGPGILIHGNDGSIGGSSVINEGTIIADNSGMSPPGSFVADTDFYGGTVASTTVPIDTSGAANPAPEEAYQSARYGVFSYTLRSLAPFGQYTVRLDFAELQPDSRAMDVIINGTTVLTNFDIYAAAGALDKAVDETFTTNADGSGLIAISFIDGSLNNNAYQPAVNGIEVYSGNTQVLAIDAGLLPDPGTLYVAGNVTNQGTMQALNGEWLAVDNLTNTAGSTISSNGSTLLLRGTLTNQAGGLITATNSTVMLGDPWDNSTNAWSNAGTINSIGGALDLGGVFTLPGMGTLNYTSGTVDLEGTLDNTGTTLALNAATGSWSDYGGIIKNGTITESGARNSPLLRTQSRLSTASRSMAISICLGARADSYRDSTSLTVWCSMEQPILATRRERLTATWTSPTQRPFPEPARSSSV